MMLQGPKSECVLIVVSNVATSQWLSKFIENGIGLLNVTPFFSMSYDLTMVIIIASQNSPK